MFKKSNYIQTKVTVLVDGLIVFSKDLEVVKVGESNTDELLKRYNPFESEMKLTKKQWKKLIKNLKNTDGSIDV